MEKNNEHMELFTPSGCLTAEAMRSFVNGELNPDETVRVTDHLSECEFCSTALEGICLTIAEKGIPGLDNSLEILRDSWQQKLAESAQPMPSRKTRVLWTALSVAATLAVLFGLYQVIRLYLPHENRLAVNPLMVLPSQPGISLPRPPTDDANQSTEADPWRVGNLHATPSGRDSSNRVYVLDDARYRNTLQLTDEDFRLEERQIPRSILKDAVSPGSVTKRIDKSGSGMQSYTNSPPTVVQTLESKTEQHYRSKTRNNGKGELASTQQEVQLMKEVVETPIFTVVEEMPSFPGGESARRDFLASHIQFPESARLSNISGTVFVSFIIDADGKLDSIRVARGIGGGCDEEALRVVKLMPRWIPGKQAGKAVKVRFTLPIKFALN